MIGLDFLHQANRAFISKKDPSFPPRKMSPVNSLVFCSQHDTRQVLDLLTESNLSRN